MRVKGVILFILLIFNAFNVLAQGRFRILGNKNYSEHVKFSLVNNMIVIQAEINGKELSFLLDTGVKATMLFNLKVVDSIQLNNVEKLTLRGLGEGNSINALKSRGNNFQLKSIVNTRLTTYVITDDLFDLTAKLGQDIHGIIGGDIFNDFIIEINYSKQRLTFYDPDHYDKSSCKNCETFPLDFYNNKPYLHAIVKDQSGKNINVKLLIDSGGGDSLWLFPHSDPDITIGSSYFEDFLGAGLNGNIMGKRGRIDTFSIGSFQFDDVLVSYPDSTSIVRVHANKDRNGTLGSELLKRFHITFDYRNRQISLKKNKRNFNAPFLYNKSGMEIMYGGEMLVNDKRVRLNHSIDGKDHTLTDIFYSYGLTYKPSYKVALVRNGSPAHFAGIRVGDILLEINGKPAYSLEMENIVYLLSQPENKRIKVLIDRDGQHLRYQFKLKSLL